MSAKQTGVGAAKTASKKQVMKKTAKAPMAKKSALKTEGIAIFKILHPEIAATVVSRIDKPTAMQRTIIMLSREWKVDINQIAPNSKLLSPPLNGNADALGNLKEPIMGPYFGDVKCVVTKTALRALAVPTSTVTSLRDLIWAGIPQAHRIP